MSLPPAVADAELGARGDAWQPSLRFRLREAWDSRRLLPALAKRNMPDYSQMKLGRSWFVIRPFMGVFGMALIFGAILGARAPEGIPYIVFLLFGLAGWRMFQQTAMRGTRTLSRYRTLILNLNMPLLLVPLTAAGLGLVFFVVLQAFAAITLGYYGVTDGELYLELAPALLVAVAGWGLCLLFALGVATFLALATAKVPDVRLAMRYVLTVWMFCTPVVYPLERIPDRFRALSEANPLTAPMEMIRYGTVGAGELRPLAIVWSVAAILATCVAAVWVFNKYALRVLESAEERLEDDGGEEEF